MMQASMSSHATSVEANTWESYDDPTLSTTGLGKSFGPVAALADINFEIHSGEIRALCGENGAGKSTFIKLLTGVYQPDTGAMRVNGVLRQFATPLDAQRAGIALVSQELSICPSLSVFDNIWLGTLNVPLLHKRSSLRRRARDALDLLGMASISLDVDASRLTMGERQIVEIARMLTRDARVLLLDEPSATLSDSEISKMMAALKVLKRQGRSIIYITHRMDEVFELCDTASVFRNGRHVETRSVRGLNRPQLIELMQGYSHETLYPEESHATSKERLTVHGLTVPGHVWDLSFDVTAGSIVCLVGQIGSGTDVVVRSVAGLEYAALGHVRVNGRPIDTGSAESAIRSDVMYVSGDRATEGIFQTLSVSENLVATRLGSYARFGFVNTKKLNAQARNLASRVKVSLQRLGSPANELSGGNQQKLAFGRCIDRGGPGLLVMNEPTRGIDVGARADIYALIRKFCAEGHAVLIASTDLEEVIGIADWVITMYRGSTVACYPRGALSMQQIVADITHPLH